MTATTPAEGGLPYRVPLDGLPEAVRIYEVGPRGTGCRTSPR